MIITDLKILRTKSKDCPDDKVGFIQLIKTLEDELANSENPGVGLSAIQINVPIKVAIVRTEKLSLDLYNTEIVSGHTPIISKGEGCLSIPNTFMDTIRMNNITIKNGDGKVYELNGFEAIICQHEIDHFAGILITDRVVKKEN